MFQGNGSLFCSTQAGDVSGRTKENESTMKNIQVSAVDGDEDEEDFNVRRRQ